MYDGEHLRRKKHRWEVCAIW